MSNNGEHDRYEDPLYKEIKALNDILTPMASSYRLMAGAAEELNRIALAHRRDVEDAIDRADDMGHIVEDIQKRLKRVLRRYYKDLDCRLEEWDRIRESRNMYESLGQKLKKMVDDRNRDV
jgi:hypothetical protein